MKNVCLIFSFILVCISLSAQGQRMVRGIGNLNPYVGTWVYQSNDTVFKIVLQKGRQFLPNVTFVGLAGSYFLSVRGKVIDNYIGFLPESMTVGNYSNVPDNLCIWANHTEGNDSLTTPLYMNVIFYDKRKKHFNGRGIGSGYLKLLSPQKILWQMDEKQAIWWETEGSEKVIEPIGFSVPEHAVMIKEK